MDAQSLSAACSSVMATFTPTSLIGSALLVLALLLRLTYKKTRIHLKTRKQRARIPAECLKEKRCSLQSVKVVPRNEDGPPAYESLQTHRQTSSQDSRMTRRFTPRGNNIAPAAPLIQVIESTPKITQQPEIETSTNTLQDVPVALRISALRDYLRSINGQNLLQSSDSATSRLSTLSESELAILWTDTVCECIARNGKVDSLPRVELPETRQQARLRIASLSLPIFLRLVQDVVVEYERRQQSCDFPLEGHPAMISEGALKYQLDQLKGHENCVWGNPVLQRRQPTQIVRNASSHVYEIFLFERIFVACKVANNGLKLKGRILLHNLEHVKVHDDSSPSTDGYYLFLSYRGESNQTSPESFYVRFDSQEERAIWNSQIHRLWSNIVNGKLPALEPFTTSVKGKRQGCIGNE